MQLTRNKHMPEIVYCKLDVIILPLTFDEGFTDFARVHCCESLDRIREV